MSSASCDVLLQQSPPFLGGMVGEGVSHSTKSWSDSQIGQGNITTKVKQEKHCAGSRRETFLPSAVIEFQRAILGTALSTLLVLFNWNNHEEATFDFPHVVRNLACELHFQWQGHIWLSLSFWNWKTYRTPGDKDASEFGSLDFFLFCLLLRQNRNHYCFLCNLIVAQAFFKYWD